MRARIFFVLTVVAACVAVAVVGNVSAQPATGTVTGRVLWGSCIRAIPLPNQPEAQPGQAPEVMPPGPASRPVPQPVTGLPAGAVLVAVQNTNVSARTDEGGRFTLSGVPAGQYFTVAAGPVADSMTAIAERPNVFINGGQSADIGTLSLGGSPVGGFNCRFPVPAGAEPAPAAPADQPQPTNP
jgi:hypothetical protein